ncbi:Multifunctional non-homologous end joining protein LigD [Xylophilus ampelinus]|nr:DNA ligase D [Variovorax sp.]VTY37714.1 Multifunctional non-homologous end joining protein LigD [Xylophilus ampelinus]
MATRKTTSAAPRAGGSAAERALADYRRNRDFAATPEPAEGGDPAVDGWAFVVQKHDASHLHYDFRLELDGTLKSWAVPKGPCLDPSVKRMAVEVEDHPLAYGGFEGTIPEGHYGAGTVIVWDRGTWWPEGDARRGLKAGKLKFELRGEKLKGHWTLVRMKARGNEKKPAWLLIKEKDAQARPLDDYDVEAEAPDSVLARRPSPARKAAAAAPAKAKAVRAPKARLPAELAPQLATLATSPPGHPEDWLWELKFDGYRLLMRFDAEGRVRCFTRNGLDWTSRVPELAKALQSLKLRSSWLDGEIGVENAQGAPDFQALQNAFDRHATGGIVCWLFDAPFLEGRDLRDLPVQARREALSHKLDGRAAPALRFSEAFDASPADLLASSARIGFEGIIGKRRDAPYVSRRSADWIKLKNHRRQEFVIGGYTAPKGSRQGFGALLLGVHDAQGRLRYAGNVGTGFDAQRLADVHARLRRIDTDTCPFDPRPTGLRAGTVQWVRPRLVAEVEFGEWTRDDRVRQAVFHGLRTDKPPRQIVREHAQPVDAPAMPASTSSSMPARTAAKSGGLRITNADRVIDKASGTTKGDLVRYYADVAPLMLPHLKGRPVSLVRAPEGVGGELFFQKHAQHTELPGVKLLDPALDRDHDPLLQIDTARGLLSAAQMNTLEFHTWNGTSSKLDTPDRMTFDLDPGEGVGWPHMQEAALLVRTLLDELGLAGFLKTSGGKGLHVVVPIRRQHGWDTVKDFSRAVVAHLAQTIPERFVVKSGPKNRVGKIFVDYLRNGFGATTVSAWSVRARPGLGVSVPVGWDELPELTAGAQWTLADARTRFETGNAPWEGMERARKGLAGPMKVLGFTPDDVKRS